VFHALLVPQKRAKNNAPQICLYCGDFVSLWNKNLLVPQKRAKLIYMETVRIKQQSNRLYSIQELVPVGGSWVTVGRDYTKEEAEGLLPRTLQFRQKKVAHLKDVRQLLVKDYGADPQSFDPIVE
jgi:hypothetical protein